jgi:hypothetical protein
MGYKRTALLFALLASAAWLLFVPNYTLHAQPDIAQKRWHWFSAISLQDDWSVLKGEADVIIKNNRITAELYDAKGGLRMSVAGILKDNHIKATVIREGTDDMPRKLTGTINRFKGGRSSILLSEKNAGGLVVGLTVD